MNTTKSKKGLSLLLAIIMVFSMIPTTIFSLATDTSLPVIKAFTSVAGDFHAYKTEIVTVTILDYIDEAEYAACSPNAWDISASSTTGTVKAWMKVNAEETAAAGATRYDVYIGGDGGVAANEYSADLFWNFKKLKEIKGLENFDTSNATNFSYMFNMCESLESLDLSSWDTSKATTFLWMFNSCFALKELNLSGWNTSNVTNMNSMFKNCKAITELDISSFDTSKVTNMNSIFFNCIVLSNLYVGEGWSIKNVTDGAMAFNCCDALPGFDPLNSQASINFADKYTKPVSEKPQPDKKTYTVTYSFAGDIPEGATAPEAAEYDEGTTVTVAGNPSADGYIFSGWKTEDAEVKNGEFTLNNDVNFVGTWTKLYKVTYMYTEGYEVPEGAPQLPVSFTYAPGELVDVVGVVYVDRYLFVGWYTEDIDIAGNSFFMPEKDITLYGYFKIPVESIEVVNPGDIVLNYGGEKGKVNVYVKPEDATIKDLVYKSEDETVAKIDEYGNITPVGEGETTITVYSKDDPSKRDTVTVKVKVPVTDITVDEKEFELKPGNTKELNVTVNPEKATNKKIIYESDNEESVTIDENGIITAKKDGTATITITSVDNPDAKETVTVTVKTPVTEITVPENKKEINLFVNEETEIEAKVNDDATVKELTYDTEDPGVAKVDSEGKIIAVGEGTTTITITSKDDPAITETVTVTVKLRQYKVTYKFIGDVIPEGVTVPEEATYEEGTTVSVAENASEEGYIFSGWTSEDADITGGSFNINKDVVIKGSWTKLYNVTYEYEGDIPANAPALPVKESYVAGNEVNVKVVPSVEGYTFTGWNTSDATISDGKFTMPEKDVVLKGKFEKIINYYNVSYEFTGDVPATATLPEPKTYEEGTNVVVENAPSVDGYIFSGWTSEDADITGGSFNINKDVVIKGSWTKLYNVTYEYEGAVPANAHALPVKESYVAGNEVNVKVVPSVEGYTFTGWYTSDAIISDGKFTMPEKDVVLKGKFEKIINYYNVEYKYTGDVPASAPKFETKTYEEGTNVVVENAPSVDGYIFSGWSTTDADITKGNFDITNDVVIIGKWTKINYYNVEYKYEGDVPANAPTYETKTYREGTTVAVESNPSVEGYKFLGWTSNDTDVTSGTFNISKNVTITGRWEILPGPVTSVTAPEKITIVLGENPKLDASVNMNATNKGLYYISNNENVIKIDENGNITTVGEGTALITVASVENPAIYTVVEVTVTAKSLFDTKHFVVFGKTEKIGWYSVSLDGGKTFFTQFGNDHLEVEKGTVMLVRANDIFGDPFTFYINGKSYTPDENGYVSIVVDQYLLIGALGIPVTAPDAEESLNFFEKIIKAFKDFFAKIAAFFKF